MKAASRICWLLAATICLSEARYKLRRPLPASAQPPPQLFKKSWPIAHRMSMGNTLHIGGNFGHKRPPLYKPANYRIRRPPMYNVLPNTWKNQVPVLGVIKNHAVLPQLPPVKEFHSMNKVPEYSPEYRPETAVMPPTHRGGIDDDKGAIHTIPAPNLSPADKPYNLVEGNDNPEGQLIRHQYPNDGHYSANIPGTLVTNFDFGTLVTSVAPQRTITSPSPTENQYEVTETNEIVPKDYHTVQPTYYTRDFDATRLATPLNSNLQTNQLFLNHPGVVNGLKPGLIDSNIEYGQSNAPIQTNLHSSLHVGFPATAGQSTSSLAHQVPDLHVGHPAPAGPPLSATQLYDLLNSFPQQVNEQYTTVQQPQLQQHIIQQQIGELFQPTGGVNSFSQPQMHSFNYDEQANKQQQQQQIIVDQDYASGRVTADYNLEPETLGNPQNSNIRLNNINGNSVVNNEELGYRNSESGDQAENHIEYEESNSQTSQNTYLSNVAHENGMSTQFYTTLPNKDTAEKLAALAAAGNVNSHLIGQIRKQQQQQQQQQQEQQQLQDQRDIEQSDEPLPTNHKDGDYEVSEPQDDDIPYDTQQQQQYSDQQEQQQQRYDEKQQLFDDQQYNRQNYRQQQQIRQQQELNDRYEQQRFSHRQRQNEGGQLDESNKRPMRIMVPEVEEYTDENSQRTSSGTENTSQDYDYENPEPEVINTRTTASSDRRTTYKQNPISEFGTRLTAIKA